jgi:AhpD family alkylhydroperoxidase
MGHYHSLVKDIQGPTRELRGMIPEIYEGFAQIHHAAYSDGALSSGTKELIAIAIAIVEGCEGCIASHARAAARKGVTPEQMAEMIGVSIQMQGGPATVYGPKAWEAFKEFKERYG